ncbi:MAG: alginate export family protein [Gemmataceae bacterium]
MGIALAFLLVLPGVSFCQSPDAAPVTPETVPSQNESVSQESASTERTWSGAPQKSKSQKTFWENTPPIQPFPRQGNFMISPSGPGYYTLFDAIHGRYLNERSKNPYLQWGQNANPLFNVDFRYLDDPKYQSVDPFDPLKRIHLGDNWLFSTGGEFRDRYASIQNAALYNKLPSAGADDVFNLYRTRIYSDVWYLDRFRIYGEFLSANASSQSIPASAADVAKNDIADLFFDLKLFELGDNGVYARVGRQELIFGSQRQVSPSDWSNVRRTFQGIRLSYLSDKIEEDIFVTNPVIPSTNTISSIDQNQQFLGNWFKYRIDKDMSIDAYYLFLNNENPGVAKGFNNVSGGFDVHTFGSRFIGQKHQILWDFEGSLQSGRWANQRTDASMYLAGLGYWFKNVPSSPTFWVYYDYASGDANPGKTDVHRTFNPLFPFGHSYFAGLDAIGRSNIRDFHLELGAFPANWVRLTAGYHILHLDQAADALYNSTGSVVRQDLTGKSGTDVGQAVNGTVQFHIDDHQIFLVNIAHLFAGPYIKATAKTPGAAKDLDAIWLQYNLKW